MTDRLQSLQRKLRFRITRGERLLLSRRRSLTTQREMAELFGVSLDRYRAWENGFGEVPAVDLDDNTVTLAERVFLLRRRKDVTLGFIGHQLGRSLSWAHTQEQQVGSKGFEEIVDFLLTLPD